jgi:tripartite-type tricarboxylate transporter receptor subunit TctC
MGRVTRGLMVGAWLAVAASGSIEATAQTYPARPITLICPLAAGSTTDILSRAIAAELGKRLGQNVIVDDRAGAGGTIAMRQAAKAAPDGYTLIMGTNSTWAINVGLYTSLGYDPVKDFAPILNIATSSNVLFVPAKSPLNSLADLIAAVRRAPDQFTFASGGNGTTHHLSGALFNRMANLESVHIPYKGAPQGINAVVSGEASFGFFNTPNVVGLVQASTVKGLAVTSKQRSPLLPNLPTMEEAGLPGYETTVSFGLMAPAGTPAEIVARLHDETAKLLADAALRQNLTAQGFDVLPTATPAEFTAQITADIARWVPIVKASGATVD